MSIDNPDIIPEPIPPHPEFPNVDLSLRWRLLQQRVGHIAALPSRLLSEEYDERWAQITAGIGSDRTEAVEPAEEA